MQIVEDNTTSVRQREKEITQIVKSIQDLNEIFRDLSQMVVDQGTILDRIDYNVEHASVQVEKGLQQLQKAEKYQKKNRKMLIIIILTCLIIILIIVLIGVKSQYWISLIVGKVDYLGTFVCDRILVKWDEMDLVTSDNMNKYIMIIKGF